MIKFSKLELKQIINPLLPFLDNVEDNIKKFISSDLSVINIGAKQVFLKPGKKVRASFVLLGAALSREINNKSNNFDLQEAVALGAGVELVHAATLIHDDIIDNANIRRGVKTVSKRWDSKIAVLVGDWLFTRGLDIAAMEKNPKILPMLIDATREMVKGELAQIEFSSVEKIDEEKYLKIITAKTAKFLGACIQVGSLNQWLDDELAAKLFQFGYLCGLGFQITDDAMDFSDKKITGKDHANDYMDGKVTLPVIYLMDKGKSHRKEVEMLYQDRNPEKFARLKEMVLENVMLDKALAKAKNYIHQGIQILDFFEDSLKMNSSGGNETINILRNLAQFFIQRQY